MRALALYGRPGAGKSTLAGMLRQELESSGVPALTVRLGAPLYELQALIHAVAGRPLLDDRAQDGELLNVLGAQLRRINPDALTDAFAQRVRQARRESGVGVLLCDDMRAPDVEAVAALGFCLVEVAAPDGVRRGRRHARGDLSAGDENHSTEAPVRAAARWRVRNAGSLEELRQEAARIAAEVVR